MNLSDLREMRLNTLAGKLPKAADVIHMAEVLFNMLEELEVEDTAEIEEEIGELQDKDDARQSLDQEQDKNNDLAAELASLKKKLSDAGYSDGG